MKQGKALTLEQKKILSNEGYNWRDFKFFIEDDECYVFCTKEEKSSERTYIRIEKK